MCIFVLHVHPRCHLGSSVLRIKWNFISTSISHGQTDPVSLSTSQRIFEEICGIKGHSVEQLWDPMFTDFFFLILSRFQCLPFSLSSCSVSNTFYKSLHGQIFSAVLKSLQVCQAEIPFTLLFYFYYFMDYLAPFVHSHKFLMWHF